MSGPEFEPLEPLPFVDHADLRLIVRDLKPGGYRSLGLYRRYVTLMDHYDRRPVSHYRFSCSMRTAGYRPIWIGNGDGKGWWVGEPEGPLDPDIWTP